jgi:short-subunit dehydrogenase
VGGTGGTGGTTGMGSMGERRQLSALRVLVTGASSGIGADLSRRLVAAGARVFGTGRAAGSLARLGVEATMALDLTEPGAPAELVEAAIAALGHLDVVVSNAGAGWAGPYASMTQAELDEIIDINLRVPMQLARAAAAHLADGGHLVLVGSIAGLLAVPNEAAYAASKAGLRGLADSLRAEWTGATVTLVSPGPVATPFFSRRNRPYERSWPRPVPVERVAGAILTAIEQREADVVVPAWMALAARLSGGAPGLYRTVSRLPERYTR